MADQARRSQLTEMLSRSLCRVTFTKVDGTQRTMDCTLRSDSIPPPTKSDHASQKRVREISEAVMVVYCPDIASWRSFRVDNVTSIEELPNAVD